MLTRSAFLGRLDWISIVVCFTSDGDSKGATPFPANCSVKSPPSASERFIHSKTSLSHSRESFDYSREPLAKSAQLFSRSLECEARFKARTKATREGAVGARARSEESNMPEIRECRFLVTDSRPDFAETFDNEPCTLPAPPIAVRGMKSGSKTVSGTVVM